MKESSPIEVLIVGAGPTGLTLACELQKHNINYRLIEKRPQASIISRATNIQPRTLEIFKFMGIEERFLEMGHQLAAGNIYVKNKLKSHINIGLLDLKYPFVLVIPQSQTEAILTQYLTDLGGKIDRDCAFLSYQETKRGLTCTINDRGTIKTIDCQYLISCEGGNSSIRTQAGIDFKGFDYKEGYLLADVFLDWERTTKQSYTFFHEKDIFIVMPFKQKNLWRLFANIDPTLLQENPQPDLAFFQELFRLRTGDTKTTITNPQWISVFHIGKRLAQQYRKGRVFLAGDAAHIHNPLGGQGINTGIQDAFNLAWKLAYQLKYKGGKKLLNTYEIERKPIAANVLESTHLRKEITFPKNTAIQLFRNHCILNVIRFKPLQKYVLKNSSQLKIHYRKSSLSQNYFAHQWTKWQTTIRAGNRLPNITLQQAEKPFKLFSLINTTHFLAFFYFPYGEIDTVSLNQITTLQTQYQSILHCCLISPDKVFHPTKITHLQDKDKQLAQTFQIPKNKSLLFLVRPDAYIALVNCPIELNMLDKYLQDLLPHFTRSISP